MRSQSNRGIIREFVKRNVTNTGFIPFLAEVGAQVSFVHCFTNSGKNGVESLDYCRISVKLFGKLRNLVHDALSGLVTRILQQTDLMLPF
jgi:hypothetical protein